MRIEIIRYLFSASIFIPLIIGVFLIRKIHTSYYWFMMYLGLDFFVETIFLFVKGFALINLIQNIHASIAMIALLMTLFQWGYLSRDKSAKQILLALFMIIPIVDFICQYGKDIQIPWAFLITGFAWILMAVNLLNKKPDGASTLKFMRSKRLILLPLMISYLYFIVLNILMAFLFSPSTQRLFQKMYYVITYLNLFSYICFSIALLWAPKKQQYL